MKNLLKLCLSLMVIVSVSSVKTYAEEMSVTDRNRMLGAVAKDWESANLREWLNSDRASVQYTALPPSYGGESGFLSDTNFTQGERDGIAVTRHGGGWQYSLDGNVNNTLYYSQRSVAHNDLAYNDKVFILHYTDLLNYIEKNKMLLSSNTKYFSDYLQRTTNKKDKYNYLVNSGYYNSGYTGNSWMYTSTLTQVAGRNSQNIVPALSLKPDYVLSNGTRAGNLTIGSTVNFGRYNGEPIEWQVINVSDEGYPLLWATRILTVKEYDVQGDINPSKSNFINYQTYNVDISTENGQAKSWETGRNIDSTTAITILNESDLMTPTNNSTIPIQIRVSDTKYPIRKITLPDGTVVNGSSADWEVPANGEYDIIAENSQGIITVRHIITKAINTPAEVLITTDKASSSKWSNKPVAVTVSASNNGVYTKFIPGNREMFYGSSSASAYPNWMSLGGKRMRVRGTIRNAMTDEEASQVDMNANVYVRLNLKWYSVNQIGWNYPIMWYISLKDLKEIGEAPIDIIYTIPNNTYESLNPTISLMSGNSDYMKPPYNYWMSDFEFEILDKDDLKIEQIILPDGNVVTTDKVTYTISTNGSYTFSARDNRGKVTSKTIELAIDTVKPSLEIINTKSGYSNSTVLQINATDDLSGIKSIKLPNGETRSTNAEGQPLSITYNIIQNGSYSFTAEDYAGNTITKTITVSNVDATAPNGTAVKNPSSWTSSDVTISITATDNSGGAGVDYIILPSGAKVTGSTASYTVDKNGIYNFKLVDRVGNEKVLSVDVGNIDKVSPQLTVTKNNSWSNSTVMINISLQDFESGIKELLLPNGNKVTGSSATYSVSEVGVYYFTAIDNVGNSTSRYVIVDNIDKVKPQTSISNNQEWNNSSSVPVTITGADN